MDTAGTTGGKQDPSKKCLRSILIYKSHMYKEASLDPERCTQKTNQKARNSWVALRLDSSGTTRTSAARPHIPMKNTWRRTPTWGIPVRETHQHQRQ